jgi:hypothetical protein
VIAAPDSEHSLDGRCAFTAALFVLGFAYVAMVLCGRSTPVASGDNAWNDWLGVVLSGPAMFLLSTRHTLLPFDAGAARVLVRNGLGFTLPFFAGLHWEWVGRFSGANFSLKAHDLTYLDTASRVAAGLGILLAAALTALCLREANRRKILVPYLASFGGLVGAIVGTTLALGADYHVHIHHYFLALCLMPFVRFPHPICLVTQAIMAGVFVEGACRWGLSPIWYPNS